jgi:hypothetical protein
MGHRGSAAAGAGAPALVLSALAAIAGAACAPPPEEQLCEAIAKRDVPGVRAALQRAPINLLKQQGGCTPVEAAFARTGPEDHALTEIGVELVKAGLPPEAAWDLKDGGRVMAVVAAATNGNATLVRALLAVGLRVEDRETIRALHAAAAADRLDVVKVMVEEGVDPAAELDGRPPAATAHAQQHDRVERFLLDEIATRAAAAEMAAKVADMDAKEAAENSAEKAATAPGPASPPERP